MAWYCPTGLQIKSLMVLSQIGKLCVALALTHHWLLASSRWSIFSLVWWSWHPWYPKSIQNVESSHQRTMFSFLDSWLQMSSDPEKSLAYLKVVDTGLLFDMVCHSFVDVCRFLDPVPNWIYSQPFFLMSGAVDSDVSKPFALVHWRCKTTNR